MKAPRMGRPLKSPVLGRRVPLCVRVPESTVTRIREAAGKRRCSQADVIVAAVSRLP